MLAHSPLTTPQGTQLRGPSGSLRCSIFRGPPELASLRLGAPNIPRAISRQLCATRPLRWEYVVRAWS